MNAAHVHLWINHLPVLGVIAGFVLLLLARMSKKADIGWAAMIILVVAALFAVPTYFSGGQAEGVVEHMPGVIEDFIAPHESMGMIFLIGAVILGAVAAYGVWQVRGSGQVSKGVSTTLLVLSPVVSGVAIYTAYLGGQVRHVELRPGFVVPPFEEGAGQRDEDGGRAGS